MKQDKKTLELSYSELYVKDLSVMKQFYTSLVGLQIINESKDRIELGFNKKVIIILQKREGFFFESVNEAGLYHNALLFSTRYELANAVQRVLTNKRDQYQGSADHLVSEAFYFSDPENNGLELYFDKPRSEWTYNSEGKPIMGSVYIDEVLYIHQYINQNDEESSRSKVDISDNIKLGHIHLKVGNIDVAKKFYVDLLMFDTVWDIGTALFISRDGYHHHLGMNIWQSNGAPVRRDHVYGLSSFQIQIYDSNYFLKIKENLTAAKLILEENNNQVATKDPWGNLIYLRDINADPLI